MSRTPHLFTLLSACGTDCPPAVAIASEQGPIYRIWGGHELRSVIDAKMSR